MEEITEERINKGKGEQRAEKDEGGRIITQNEQGYIREAQMNSE